MKFLLLFIAINIVFSILIIFIDLVSAKQNNVEGFIEKPKWCNSFSISNYHTQMEVQKEYKYPCATII